MIRTIRPTSTTASLLAGAALLVAVAGSGAAVAGGLAKNSVDSRNLKNESVRGVDLAPDSVTGLDVDEHSLGTVPAADHAATAGSAKTAESAVRAEVAEAAGTADSALTAGTADVAKRLLGMVRASVSADGQLRPADFGAVGAEQTSTPGRYVVTLDGPHLGCLLVPAVAHNSVERVAGSASAWFTPPLLETGGRKVTVETHAPDGNGVPDPLPFSLLVLC
ncbi:hypothetical protein [Nocardioides sp.]|uniref:hypothetical protein n=1 Tax=Nocardioides sp. TaxID=35761 RepID=UPI001A2051D6|nr:hypothetical protein [Nocardioides sp.]MBJ7358183.1 hypothetical protein [Nocardioides sp.]